MAFIASGNSLRPAIALTRRPGILFHAEKEALTRQYGALRSASNSSSPSQLNLPQSRTRSLPAQHDPTPLPSSLSLSSQFPRGLPPSVSIWSSVRSALGFQVAHKVPAGYVPAAFTIDSNPYRAKKIWPPNFDRLTPRHRFHFEKTYRRRAKLKYACPGWRRGVGVVQNVSVLGVTIYFLFFLTVEEDGVEVSPFQGLRDWVYEQWSSVGSSRTPRPVIDADNTGKDPATSKAVP